MASMSWREYKRTYPHMIEKFHRDHIRQLRAKVKKEPKLKPLLDLMTCGGWLGYWKKHDPEMHAIAMQIARLGIDNGKARRAVDRYGDAVASFTPSFSRWIRRTIAKTAAKHGFDGNAINRQVRLWRGVVRDAVLQLDTP